MTSLPPRCHIDTLRTRPCTQCFPGGRSRYWEAGVLVRVSEGPRFHLPGASRLPPPSLAPGSECCFLPGRDEPATRAPRLHAGAAGPTQSTVLCSRPLTAVRTGAPRGSFPGDGARGQGWSPSQPGPSLGGSREPAQHPHLSAWLPQNQQRRPFGGTEHPTPYLQAQGPPGLQLESAVPCAREACFPGDAVVLRNCPGLSDRFLGWPSSFLKNRYM